MHWHISHQNTAITALVLTLSSTPFPAVTQTALPQIVSVGDGDTLRVRQGNQLTTLRLACVDAPETSQRPWGQQSANRLKQLLPPGQAVRVRAVERDRYGRTVAELYLGNQSVNLQLVKEGMAVVYRQYLSGCADTKNEYLQVEAEAKRNRLGFWNQPNPVMPWDFRRGQSAGNQPSSASTTPALPPTNNLPACVNSDCNCSDFASQAEAQRVFNAFPGDPQRLDGDGDQVACESLP